MKCQGKDIWTINFYQSSGCSPKFFSKRVPLQLLFKISLQFLCEFKGWLATFQNLKILKAKKINQVCVKERVYD